MKTAVTFFGRMNPPTTGHAKLIAAVEKIAAKENADILPFVSKTQDAKKNPLSYKQKLKYLKQMFPSVPWKENNVKTFIQVAEEVAKRGYERMIFIAGSDRVPEYTRILEKYNGKLFDFKKIEVVSAGQRDDNAKGVAGMSASKMRKLAAEGNERSFVAALPRTMSSSLKKQLYNDVRSGMNLE